MKKPYVFSSKIGASIAHYLDIKKTLGRQYSVEYRLRR